MASNQGISLHVTVYVDPENVSKFLEHFKPVYDKSPEDPGTLHWVENWNQTTDWLLNVQIPKDYYKEYFAATEPMFVKPREFKVYNRLGSPYYTAKER
ncbi:ABM domain-containing protein [Fusarium sp. Ph1]|nr:ABM domain-containing protein [Fusarium sp. Ph1]